MLLQAGQLFELQSRASCGEQISISTLIETDLRNSLYTDANLHKLNFC